MKHIPIKVKQKFGSEKDSAPLIGAASLVFQKVFNAELPVNQTSVWSIALINNGINQ